MKVVIQRVLQAEVLVDGEVVGKTGQGILALVGFGQDDNDSVMDYIVHKLLNLRIFADEQGKMNLSVQDVGGGILVVPNFTLYGDTKKGMRPSFTGGANPETANGLFHQFVDEIKSKYRPEKIGCGIFQADMIVRLENDGPVTFILEKS